MSRPRTALVIGGGIGGLAAAIALRRVGIDAEVFERAPEIQEVGAGLSLWSNAVRALRRLGVEYRIVPLGSPIERAVTVTPRGDVLSEAPIGDLARAVGAPSVCVHRAVLQARLAEALDPGRLHTSSPCVGVEQDRDGVTARFADGRAARGDILIGADGLHSVVREALLGKAPPRYAGYFAWRGIAPIEPCGLPPGQALFALGRGIQVGVFGCGPGRTYWFATRNAPAGTPEPPGGRRREALEAVEGWTAPVVEAIRATEEAAVLRNDVYDRGPTPLWGEGRVTLLGDAVHPTTPNLGQGACQALEDAVVLADALRRTDDTPSALRAYEARRRDRTALVTRRSWSLGAMFQWHNPLAAWARDRLVRTRLSKRQGMKLFEELLGYDLPELPTG